MVKIKLDFFESVVATLMLPNIGFVMATIILIVSLIVKQKATVYKGIAILFLICFVLGVLMVLVCFLISLKSKKEFIIYDDKFEFLQHQYLIEQIISCKYYVCKWYQVPIAFIYKEQAAGLIDIKLISGEKIQFKVFYNDYLKLKKHINNIIEI